MSMTLQFIDGFDHYATNQIARKYPSFSGTSYCTIVAGRSGNCLKVTSNDTYVSIPQTAAVCWLVGFGYKYSGTPNSNGPHIIRFYEAGGNAQVSLRVSGDGSLAVMNNGVVVATSGSFSLAPDTWYHIAFATKIGNSGSYDVWVDGIKRITGTGDTYNTGNVNANSVRIGQGTGYASSGSWFDDLYVYTGDSYVDGDYPGDCTVKTALPDGAGNYTDWTGTNTDVDDAAASIDDDTTYIYSATPNQVETYTFADISGSGAIIGVQENLQARKDDAGARTLAAVARLSATDVVGATQAPTTSYLNYREMFLTKPGGGAWALADVNGAEFGVKCIA